MPAPMDEIRDWLTGSEDWTPVYGAPSYRQVLQMLGEEKARVQHLRRLLREGLDAIADRVMVDPLYEMELRERGLM